MILPQTPLSLTLEELRFNWAQDRLSEMTSRRCFGMVPAKFKSRQDAEQYLRNNTPLLDWEMIECANFGSHSAEVFTYYISEGGAIYDEGSPFPAVEKCVSIQALNPDQALRYFDGKVW